MNLWMILKIAQKKDFVKSKVLKQNERIQSLRTCTGRPNKHL